MKDNRERTNVFLETGAFAAEQFNFESERLSALRQLAQQNVISLLTTHATVRECKVAIAKRKNNRRVLKAFEMFLRDSRSLFCSFSPIPLNVLCDDCAAGKFPLGRKRTLENAAPLLTLKYWCHEYAQNSFVISPDEDVRNACAANPDLFFPLKSVGDFLERIRMQPT